MASYIITRSADADIDEILAYIANDNMAAAIALNDRFTTLFEMLAENIDAGRARPEIKEDIRSFPADSYVIFYRKWAGKIAIVRVIDAARDIDELFS